MLANWQGRWDGRDSRDGGQPLVLPDEALSSWHTHIPVSLFSCLKQEKESTGTPKTSCLLSSLKLNQPTGCFPKKINGFPKSSPLSEHFALNPREVDLDLGNEARNCFEGSGMGCNMPTRSPERDRFRRKEEGNQVENR